MMRLNKEIIEFIAGGSTPHAVATWTPSREAKEEVAELIQAEKAGGISADKKIELDRCFEMEHLMRLAKARARCRDHE